MPSRTTSTKPDRTYVDKGTPDELDERGKRTVQETPKDQKQTKKDIGKNVNKPLPGAVGMTKAKPGNAESEAFDAARALIEKLRDSHDVDEHVAAFTERGKPAPSKASKK